MSLDFGHLPPIQKADVQYFQGVEKTTTTGTSFYRWLTWFKPRGASMVNILLVGSGGGGGNSVAGAASTAAGGGSGGSGSQMTLTIPAHLIPDMLYLSLHGGMPNNSTTSAVTGIISYVAIAPSQGAAPTVNNILMIAQGGGSGGASTGATAGPAGTQAAAPTVALAPLSGMGQVSLIQGQIGLIGGTTGNGTSVTIPATGLIVTAGSSGGGLPAISTAGGNGGAITGGGVFPTIAAASGGATTPTAGAYGISGCRPFKNMLYGYGGAGGGASGMSASAGVRGGDGGAGAPGCGGGGAGGSFTGFGPAVGGAGGPAFCVITSW